MITPITNEFIVEAKAGGFGSVRVSYKALSEIVHPEEYGILEGYTTDFDYQPHLDWFASCAWNSEGESILIFLHRDVLIEDGIIVGGL